jgi:trimeric autotransporter adhesin
MRISTRTLAALSGAALLVSAATASAATVNPRQSFIAPRHVVPGNARLRFSRTRALASNDCNENAETSFVGIPSASDVAGGSDSTVPGGFTNHACAADSGILAGSGNLIYNDTQIYGSAIGAGTGNSLDAFEAFVGGGNANFVNGSDGFIGSGVNNYASAAGAFVGGGGTYIQQTSTPSVLNSNEAGGQDAFVGAGDTDKAEATQSFIGSGQGNTVGQLGPDSGIVAGTGNSANAVSSAILGGASNSVTGAYATILGGRTNTASGTYASVLGGYASNASGSYAIVAGGNTDTAAGILSFAAGYHADAGHNGTFAWSDFSSGSALLKDTAANQFLVRASGGTTIYSNEGMTSGVTLTAGSGTWANLSDRNAKTDIVPLDDASILAKVAELPVNAWRYKSESGVRHVGPMAQDFYAAFGVGLDDRHITSIDEDGVALAAIKALSADARDKNAQLLGQREQIARQAADIVALRQEMRHIEAALTAKGTR